MTLAFFDGLIHILKPEYPRSIVNDLADLMTVEFLELEIPNSAEYERTKARVGYILDAESLFSGSSRHEDRSKDE